MLAISVARGRTRFELTHTSFWTMAWAVLVTSIAAVLLLLWLLNHGSAARVSSLLYLVPPMAVLQGYFLFQEKVQTIGIAGIALTAIGVALVIQS
jgi:drug/metabolite transporter (DMT)-like permease